MMNKTLNLKKMICKENRKSFMFRTKNLIRFFDSIAPSYQNTDFKKWIQYRKVADNLSDILTFAIIDFVDEA